PRIVTILLYDFMTVEYGPGVVTDRLQCDVLGEHDRAGAGQGARRADQPRGPAAAGQPKNGDHGQDESGAGDDDPGQKGLRPGQHDRGSGRESHGEAGQGEPEGHRTAAVPPPFDSLFFTFGLPSLASLMAAPTIPALLSSFAGLSSALVDSSGRNRAWDFETPPPTMMTSGATSSSMIE